MSNQFRSELVSRFDSGHSFFARAQPRSEQNVHHPASDSKRKFGNPASLKKQEIRFFNNDENLRKFKAITGRTFVRAKDGKCPARWRSKMRQGYARNSIPSCRIEALDGLECEWNLAQAKKVHCFLQNLDNFVAEMQQPLSLVDNAALGWFSKQVNDIVKRTIAHQKRKVLLKCSMFATLFATCLEYCNNEHSSMPSFWSSVLIWDAQVEPSVLPVTSICTRYIILFDTHTVCSTS